MYFNSRESYSQDLLCEGPMHLQSGDMTTGVWAFSCVVPMDLEYLGGYTGSINGYDNQNNVALLTKSVTVVL